MCTCVCYCVCVCARACVSTHVHDEPFACRLITEPSSRSSCYCTASSVAVRVRSCKHKHGPSALSSWAGTWAFTASLCVQKTFTVCMGAMEHAFIDDPEWESCVHEHHSLHGPELGRVHINISRQLGHRLLLAVAHCIQILKCHFR